MKQLMIGVCTGSVGRDKPDQLFDRAAELGVEAVQLSGMPHSFGRRSPRYVLREASGAGVTAISCSISHRGEDYSTLESIRRTGGVLMDWKRRLRNVQRAGDWLAEADVHDATTHVGHIPDDPADPLWAVIIERVRIVADELQKRGVRLALETGQETAQTLVRFLDALERPQVGVNFDPANMILYGKGDPIAALDVLGKHVVSVHCKDALYSDRPGATWGREVPFGQGHVNARAWLQKLFALGFRGPLVIEREARSGCPADIRAAVEILQSERAKVLPAS